MLSFEEKLKNIVIKLFDINALKFGNYKMKSGLNSPVYFDLRVIVSYPEVMESLSLLLHEFAQDEFDCDHICGVPYTALPIATIIAVHSKKSMLLRRKEAKNYGTSKMIEGRFNEGDTCVIVEDVVTSGASILETVKDLEKENLKVTNAVVIVNRQQGGENILANAGIKMKSLTTIKGIMEILCTAGRVDSSMVENVKTYIDKSHIELIKLKEPNPRLITSFGDRSKLATNKSAQRLLALMEFKSSNLCIAADLTLAKDVLKLASEVGEHIVLLKLHVDIIEDFTAEFVEELVKISKRYNFMIMEDRKFSDIGHLVGLQLSKGVHNIATWADIVTAHPVSGPGVLEGLKSASVDNLPSCFLVVEMSCRGHLNSPDYIQAATKMISGHEDFLSGVVCQSPDLVQSLGLVQLTPGVRVQEAGDGLGQQYVTPEQAVLERGADIAVVGRGVTLAVDPKRAAQDYRQLLWSAYKKRVEV